MILDERISNINVWQSYEQLLYNWQFLGHFMHSSKDITTLQRQHNIVRNVARRGLIKFVLVAMYVVKVF